MKKLLYTLLIIYFALVLVAQEDMQLAMEYFNAKEFEKAEVLFDKLYKSKKSKFYFDYYLDCLIFQEKFKEAENKIEKEQKSHPDDLTFYIDLGYLKKMQGDEAEAEKQYKYVLKNLPSNYNSISNIGNSFQRKKEYTWAEEVYLKANLMLNSQFLQHLANVYASQRKYDEMVSAYLDYLSSDVTKYQTVQSIFSSYLQYDVNNEFSDILQRQLIMRIQKEGKEIFEELIIWFYTENNNFMNALVYSKSLDKRKNENGIRVFRIGQLASENEDYATANSAFTYVVEKGSLYPYYYQAKFALLNVLYQQVILGQLSSEEEIIKLENSYLSLIKELGISNRTVDFIVDLAHLQAFYLNKSEAAIELLQEALNIPNLSEEFKAKFMVKLADIYVYAEKPWDAVLTYAKVEEFFPNAEITDDAKFKKAKVYFYLGEFKWAQDQWDILKGSPSKLISNDAIYWSHFIDENSGSDSLQNSLKTYASADLFFYQRNYDKALKISDSIINNFSAEPVVPMAYYLKYQVYMQLKDYINAAENLDVFYEKYSYSMWADKAIFELAQLYDYYLDEKDKAADCYKKILFDFQGSIYTEPSRERYRELSGL